MHSRKYTCRGSGTISLDRKTADMRRQLCTCNAAGAPTADHTRSSWQTNNASRILLLCRQRLRARLRHHATPVSRPHWHVDYLRQKADLIEIWYTDTDEKREHDYARLICKQPDTIQPIAGFGASDCNCTSHLIYHPMQPDVRQFKQALAMNYPGDKLYSTSVSW